MSTPLLTVDDLRVAYPRREGGLQEVVRGVSFTLGRERLGIVGESGSGKSQTGRAILGITAPGGVVSAKALQFGDVDLLNSPPRQRRALRGGRIAMVLQDPKYSLSPVMRIGAQIEETLRMHTRCSGAERRARVLQALADVGIDDPPRVARLYPHEVSGGMGQRVMIAMMLAQRPQLLIADEPTSALDVSVRQEVLALLDELVAEQGLALLFISHDLSLVSRFCDRVLVMYAGRVVESLPAAELAHAQHAYTQGLLQSLPSLKHRRAVLPVLQRDPAWRGAA
jgi:peptide/nickel transport system ATP-binding protein